MKPMQPFGIPLEISGTPEPTLIADNESASQSILLRDDNRGSGFLSRLDGRNIATTSSRTRRNRNDQKKGRETQPFSGPTLKSIGSGNFHDANTSSLAYVI